MPHGLRTRAKSNTAAPPYTNGPFIWDQDVELQGQVNLNVPGTSLTRYCLIERFNRLPQLNASVGVSTNLDFEILGTNASNDDVTFSSTVGGIQLQTDGADGDSVIVLPHLDSGQSAWEQVNWGTENQTVWEGLIRTDANVSDIIIWAGLKLTNTSTVATDADQVFFRTTGGNWNAVHSIGGTDTTVDTGIDCAVNTVYHLRIAIDEDRVARFYINGDEVASSTALTDDIDLIPYVGVEASAAAAKTLHLSSEAISRIVFE